MSTNGVIADAGEATSAWTNQSLPYSARNRSAPVFWDDLYNDCSQGGVYTRILTWGGQPSAFVVSWVNVRHFGFGGTCSG